MTTRPFKVGDKVRFKRASGEVEILATDMGGSYPVLIRHRDVNGGYWAESRRFADGGGIEFMECYHIVHAPEARTVECDLVLWPDDGVDVFADWAKGNSGFCRPLAVKHLTVTFEVGEGL